ncbi:hypothetical protein E3P81_03498 [Wallemia ichthyophaga]|nr:hypothetical protein E3P97_03535 [Wallemia ichthyophaga]TIB29222.1 hypothetical protein E3P85_03283 [Wallemia ichthyophaga]TIB44491.1 hypothetical protein E3P82_03503 [Wallemia ichthyophaga]TIB46925.1 hypothetical protein E3P81_03498 [Wallemia ichthyophaga]TIB49796.1 hypothetical protein E3P80_03507 [Wallemia ichthyophaga]
MSFEQVLGCLLENPQRDSIFNFNQSNTKDSLYKSFIGPFAPDFFGVTGDHLDIGANERFNELQNKFLGGKRGRSQFEPCGYVFKKGDVVYRCKDCAIDPTTVFCSRCFHATHPQDSPDHPFSNHQISFSLMTAGGCCDCGDPEAWRIDPGRPAHLDEPDNVNVHLPEESLQRARLYVSTIIKFIIDTIAHSPTEFTPPTNIPQVKSLPTLKPESQSEPGPWSVVLWNDERHSFDEVIEQVSLAIDCSHSTSRTAAEHGREVLKSSSDINALLKVAVIINSIDLAVTIRPSHDTYLEDICHLLLEFLFDLCHSRPQELRLIVAEELLKVSTSTHIDKITKDKRQMTNLQCLFLLESRMWKRARKLFRDMLVALLGVNQDVRCRVGLQFALVYKNLVESYLLQDHEPELSALLFSIQVFTTPSVASLICFNSEFHANSLLTTILHLIYAFLTEQRTSPKQIKLVDKISNDIIDCESTSIRHKRYLNIIHDLKTLLTNEAVVDELPKRMDLLDDFIQFFIPFTDMNQFQRAVHEHVEYESDAWINAFNCTIQLTKVTNALGDLSSNFTPIQLVTLIKHILDGIAKTMHRPTFSTKEAGIQFGGHAYDVIDYSVAYESVSFHHPLHWWLGNLLKHVQILGHFYPEGVNTRELPLIFGERARNNLLPAVAFFEQPMRVCAFVAQARCGLWVRNGFSVRGQVHHYREITFRDNTYDLDLFNVQIMFTIVDAEQALVSLLTKFDMLTWFEGYVYHSVYDEKQTPAMAEEFILLLIACLTEPTNIGGWSKEKRIERSLIHALCFGPSTYSEFTRLISDTLVDDPAFDRILNKVAKFRSPDGTSDYGTYELRDEYFEHVDPYYMNFTRNMREAAATSLQKFYKRIGKENAIHIPKKLDVPTNGPYNSFIGVYKTEVFQQIVYASLFNAFNERDEQGRPAASFTRDILIEAALHLIMCALVEAKTIFAKLAGSRRYLMHSTLVELLCKHENDQRLVNVKGRISWILDQLSDVCGDAVSASREIIQPASNEPIEDPAEARKTAAKARQTAIMEKFANQQKNLLDQLGDEDEDMEDEDDAVEDNLGSDDPHADHRDFGDCIVCQEVLGGTSFGSLAFVQPSKLLRNTPSLDPNFVYEPLWMSHDLDKRPESSPASVDNQYKQSFIQSKLNSRSTQPNTTTPGFSSEHTRLGLHMSTCGHRMHLSCFETYFASSVSRHQSQIARTQPDEPKWKEFICPLCKGLGNAIMPIFKRPKAVSSSPKITEWVRSVSIDLLKDPKVSLLNDFQEQETGSGEFWPWYARSAPSKLDNIEKNPQSALTDRLMGLIKPISMNAEDMRQSSIPAAQELSSEGMYLPGELVAYTISSIEVALRGTGGNERSVSDQVNELHLLMIESMLGCLENLATRHPVHQSNGPQIIAKGIFQRILPEFGREDNVRQPLLLRDPFSLLVETAATAPESLPPMITLTFYAQLVRTVIALIQASRTDGVADSPLLRPPAEIERLPANAEHIFGNISSVIHYMLQSFTALYNDGERMLKLLPDEYISKLMYSYMLPFLRRVSILNRVVRKAPVLFTKKSNESDVKMHGMNEEESDCEFMRLMKELEILPPNEALNTSSSRQTTIQRMVEGWCSHFGHHVQELRPRDYTLKLDYPQIYRLTALPYQLSALIDDVLTRVCPNCNQVPSDPALCLLCGASLCHQSFCCHDQSTKVGECNTHMKKCGGVVGAYFMPKKSATFYLYDNKGSFAQPPYLDAHGEVDIGIRSRGKPQYLHKRRLNEIYRIWVNHQIPSWIGRKLDLVSDQEIQPGGGLLIAWQLKEKIVVLIGGGEVAAGRIVNLLNADAKIRLICPRNGLNQEVAYRVDSGQIFDYVDRQFEDANDFKDANMVLTAIDDVETSKHIYNISKSLNIATNVADIPPNCDFYFGSIVRRGPLQILISTGGQGPRISAKLKGIVENALPKTIAPAITNVGSLRKKLRAIEPTVGGKPGVKRMKWMIKVCDNYSFDELAEMSDKDLEHILEGYDKDQIPKAHSLTLSKAASVFKSFAPVLMGMVIGSSLTLTYLSRHK